MKKGIDNRLAVTKPTIRLKPRREFCIVLATGERAEVVQTPEMIWVRTYPRGA